MAEHIEYQGNFSGSQIDTLLTKIQSSQVFTTEEKTKLASLVNYDDTEVKEDISDIETSLNSHKSDKANPHEVTKAQVGLGNVDNTSDANKPISTATQAALDNKVNKVDGKGLSTNDFTDSDKEQISANKAGIGAVANSGSKNQLDVSQTSSTMNAGNITITKGADGSLTLNGTSTVVSDVIIGRITLPAGDYVLSGCAEGGSGGTWLIRIYGEPNITNSSHTVGTVFHTDGITNASVRIVVGGNKTLTNAVFKPMICTKAEWDISQEFVLYAPTNRKLYEVKADKTEVAAIANRGSKNLLDYTFSINGNTSARTSNGVTFTINADRSISTSGTASANVTSAWIQKDYVVPNDPVILSGCPAGGADNKYRIDILDGTPTGSIVAFDYGNGAIIKSSMFTSGIGIIRIRIESGQNVDGLVFKPMIRPASITDDTYVPYAPTNRELYEMILALQSDT